MAFNTRLNIINLKKTFNMVKHFQKNVNFIRSDKEVACITNAVCEMVRLITSKVSKCNPDVEISHQYLVGSMAEGTKIQAPNEFDFIVVLKKFSETSAYDIEMIEGNKSDVRLKWNNRKGSAATKKKKYVVFGDMYFTNILTRCVSDILDVRIVGSDGDDQKEYGTLRIHSNNVCHHGPASVIKLLWKPASWLKSDPLEILVDIVPAIEKSGVEFSIPWIEPASLKHDYFYKELVEDNKFCIVHKEHDLFTLTFTNTEVRLVREMSKHHQLCYKILKYLLSVENEGVLLFKSFFIKTVVLQHDTLCQHSNYSSHGIIYRLLQPDTTDKNCLDSIIIEINKMYDDENSSFINMFTGENLFVDNKFPCENTRALIKEYLQKTQDQLLKIINNLPRSFPSLCEHEKSIRYNIEGDKIQSSVPCSKRIKLNDTCHLEQCGTCKYHSRLENEKRKNYSIKGLAVTDHKLQQIAIEQVYMEKIRKERDEPTRNKKVEKTRNLQHIAVELLKYIQILVNLSPKKLRKLPTKEVRTNIQNERRKPNLKKVFKLELKNNIRKETKKTSKGQAEEIRNQQFEKTRKQRPQVYRQTKNNVYKRTSNQLDGILKRQRPAMTINIRVDRTKTQGYEMTNTRRRELTKNHITNTKTYQRAEKLGNQRSEMPRNQRQTQIKNQNAKKKRYITAEIRNQRTEMSRN